MLKFGTRMLWALGVVMTLSSTLMAQVPLDPDMPTYRPVSSLKGELRLTGSSTMANVASVWAASFRQFYPEVKITIQTTGSRAAVASVLESSADIGLLSRSINKEERDLYLKARGSEATVVTPCLERIGVYVHKDNPIRGLTLAQIDGIFSEDCKRLNDKPIRTWGQLGFPGAWATQPVMVHGRDDDTGSQVFMQEAVMLGGTVRKDIKTHASNNEMMKGIAADPRSVGFAGHSYETQNVRSVPLSIRPEGPYVAIDSEEADHGQYPLMRPLQLVIDHVPGKELPEIEREFIRYVFSSRGQEDVIKAGFQGISGKPAHIALDSIGLNVVH
ncbi:MAG: phosphate ABC transporter substrate-binding protein [Planctomycetaceae bacterium]